MGKKEKDLRNKKITFFVSAINFGMKKLKQRAEV